MCVISGLINVTMCIHKLIYIELLFTTQLEVFLSWAGAEWDGGITGDALLLKVRNCEFFSCYWVFICWSFLVPRYYLCQYKLNLPVLAVFIVLLGTHTNLRYHYSSKAKNISNKVFLWWSANLLNWLDQKRVAMINSTALFVSILILFELTMS